VDQQLLNALETTEGCQVVVRLSSDPTEADETELKQLGAHGRGRVWAARVTRASVGRLSALDIVRRIQAAERLRAL